MKKDSTLWSGLAKSKMIVLKLFISRREKKREGLIRGNKIYKFSS